MTLVCIKFQKTQFTHAQSFENETEPLYLKFTFELEIEHCLPFPYNITLHVTYDYVQK